MNTPENAGATPNDSDGSSDSQEPAGSSPPTGSSDRLLDTMGGTSSSGGTGGTVLVAFSNPDEFLAELRDRGPNVDGVLRLTFRWHPDSSGLPISDMWVVANYLHRLDATTLALVRLDRYVGGVWLDVSDPESDKKRELAQTIRAHIQEEAEKLGIEVRAGTHLTGPPGRERP